MGERYITFPYHVVTRPVQVLNHAFSNYPNNNKFDMVEQAQ